MVDVPDDFAGDGEVLQGHSFAIGGETRGNSLDEEVSPAPFIELARRSDVDDLVRLYVRARRAAEPSIPPLVHAVGDVREWLASHVEAGNVWRANLPEGRLAGMLVLTPGWIDQLYLEPSRTGQGLGSALLAFAKSRSSGALQLWTFAANERARRFYERHDFEAVEDTDGSGNEEGAPDVRYRWVAGIADHAAVPSPITSTLDSSTRPR